MNLDWKTRQDKRVVVVVGSHLNRWIKHHPFVVKINCLQSFGTSQQHYHQEPCSVLTPISIPLYPHSTLADTMTGCLPLTPSTATSLQIASCPSFATLWPSHPPLSANVKFSTSQPFEFSSSMNEENSFFSSALFNTDAGSLGSIEVLPRDVSMETVTCMSLFQF